MYLQNKFTSVSGTRDYQNKTNFARPSVFFAGLIYLLSVVTLVLIIKWTFTSPAEISTMVESTSSAPLTSITGRIIAGLLGLLVAGGFLLASKRQAHKVLR